MSYFNGIHAFIWKKIMLVQIQPPAPENLLINGQFLAASVNVFFHYAALVLVVLKAYQSASLEGSVRI